MKPNMQTHCLFFWIADLYGRVFDGFVIDAISDKDCDTMLAEKLFQTKCVFTFTASCNKRRWAELRQKILTYHQGNGYVVSTVTVCTDTQQFESECIERMMRRCKLIRNIQSPAALASVLTTSPMACLECSDEVRMLLQWN